LASVVIPLIAAAFTALAIWLHAWILLWPAIVLFAVMIVYAARAPGAFGKQLDGRHAWWAWIVWAPMFAYMRLMHEAARSLTRESVADEVAPGVWVGRRPRAHELPAGVAIVVDLCAELGELRRRLPSNDAACTVRVDDIIVGDELELRDVGVLRIDGIE